MDTGIRFPYNSYLIIGVFESGFRHGIFLVSYIKRIILVGFKNQAAGYK
jgi:hypothetical protein